MTRKSVVVVGGGPAGCELAKALEAELDVILIEPREAFVHAPAMIRSLVNPALLNSALIPYDRVLSHGTLLHNWVLSVDDSGATLDDGTHVQADYVVVATGSSNGTLFKPKDAGITKFRQDQIDFNRRLKSAKNVAIVGAGAVGVELAGEIADAMPEKAVTLVSAGTKLFPEKPERLGKSLLKKLRHMGVEVLLGARAELGDITEPGPGKISISQGREIAADLIVPAIGARPNASLLQDLPGARMLKSGRVKVDPYFRPSALTNVFALGDVVDAGDAATIVAISRQHPWLTRTLKMLAKGASLESCDSYKPWKNAPILVPLGPRRGSSYLGIATFGDWVTRNLKGGDLFVPKYRKLLNQS